MTVFQFRNSKTLQGFGKFYQILACANRAVKYQFVGGNPEDYEIVEFEITEIGSIPVNDIPQEIEARRKRKR